jgi:hypothetical protein
MLYVSCEADLPDAESKPEDPQVLAVLHSRMQVFQNGDRSVFSLIPATTNAVDGESAFLGEVWVSQIFLNHLGDNYKPARDWRSSMRTRLGYGKYIPPLSGDETPFVIKDRNGALSQFLVEHSYMPASKWERLCPVYHIDVQTTGGPLESSFTISAARLDMVSCSSGCNVGLYSVLALTRDFISLGSPIHSDPATSNRNKKHSHPHPNK